MFPFGLACMAFSCYLMYIDRNDENTPMVIALTALGTVILVSC